MEVSMVELAMRGARLLQMMEELLCYSIAMHNL
jgi:hypothetical protein